jgi:hypothetical protein
MRGKLLLMGLIWPMMRHEGTRVVSHEAVRPTHPRRAVGAPREDDGVRGDDELGAVGVLA